MFCDRCKKKEATVFLTQIVNGKMKKANFCEQCSQEKGMDEPIGFAFPDLLLGLTVAQEIGEAFEGAASLVCDACGLSQKDFKKTGRLGCSACYTVFKDEISFMLRNMHGSVMHIGKVPAKFVATHAKTEQLQRLQASLEVAIAKEQYEKAAHLRDEICEFKKQHQTSSVPGSLTMIQELLPFEEVTLKVIGEKTAPLE